MIGIIGPTDSADLALAVARDEGIAHEVVARSYERIEEAPALAAELDELCQVILFTGRVPHASARAEGGLRASLQFVPHGGADLYRAMVHLQRRHAGALPRMSLDTIEPAIVAEAYEGLDTAPPSAILSLEVDGDPDRIRAAGDIVAFHRERHASGVVDVCVTCLGSVHRELVALGIPSWRIAHTRTVIRDSLRQAHLTARLAITEAMQPAALIARLVSPQGAPPGAYESQRRRLVARMAILEAAEALHGRMAELDDETLIVYANRTTLEAAMDRYATDRTGAIAFSRSDVELQLGIGFGPTVPAAEENARRALVLGERYGDLHVALPDGEVVLATERGTASTYRLRETQPGALALAERVGLGPLAFARLMRAVRQIDVASFTAADLARAYGIEPRSARRMMTALVRAGIAERMGVQGGPGAGRPEIVYRIDAARLLGPDRAP